MADERPDDIGPKVKGEPQHASDRDYEKADVTGVHHAHVGGEMRRFDRDTHHGGWSTTTDDGDRVGSPTLRNLLAAANRYDIYGPGE